MNNHLTAQQRQLWQGVHDAADYIRDFAPGYWTDKHPNDTTMRISIETWARCSGVTEEMIDYLAAVYLSVDCIPQRCLAKKTN
jgi:hypothetical protein